MSKFDKWKQELGQPYPPSWEDWLMVVHACLEAIEDVEEEQKSLYQKRLQENLELKAQPLYKKAESLGLSIESCDSVQSILSLHQYLAHNEQLKEQWRELVSEAESLFLSLPEPKELHSQKIRETHDQLQKQRKRVHEIQNYITRGKKDQGCLYPADITGSFRRRR